MRLAELEYSLDSAAGFAALADREWAVFLDSGRERIAGGRYDIYAAEPYATLTTRGTLTEVRTRSGQMTSAREPLDILREELGPAAPADSFLPFCGGAIGYFGYDLGRRFERWEAQAVDDIEMPELAFGLYDWAVVVDHAEQRTWLVGQGNDERTFDCWDELHAELGNAAAKRYQPFQVLDNVTCNLDRRAYDSAFNKIKAHIRDGDCYQVNLTQRFSAPVVGSSWDAYERLRTNNPAPYSAYLNFPVGQVLCSSPERFLGVRGGKVVTRPIKGTRPRGWDEESDRRLAEELRASEKDRAENVMIVDLLRNDLGRNCVGGSVQVTSLFDIETFANVHHLVSTVEGDLAPGRDALDVLRGSFPGGSITGAPKVRAMQIIEECEPQRRSVYCGAIGYLGFDGAMDTNIAIRTLLRRGETIHAWAGGGIVADSDADREYQECFDKASGLLSVLSESRISATG
ncbi:MAG: aminodeoxychorismate synthase component I [Gammaproteobacteria bacterium]